MNRTNISLIDRSSLKHTISFIERLLSEDGTMSKPTRKKMSAHVKRYQDALIEVESHLIKTGGTFSNDTTNDTVHD